MQFVVVTGAYFMLTLFSYVGMGDTAAKEVFKKGKKQTEATNSRFCSLSIQGLYSIKPGVYVLN